jgi:hypothetical protein
MFSKGKNETGKNKTFAKNNLLFEELTISFVFSKSQSQSFSKIKFEYEVLTKTSIIVLSKIHKKTINNRITKILK